MRSRILLHAGRGGGERNLGRGVAGVGWTSSGSAATAGEGKRRDDRREVGNVFHDGLLRSVFVDRPDRVPGR